MKPELLMNPSNMVEIQLLAEAGVSAFVVGDARFSLLVRGSFQAKELEAAVKLGHTLKTKVYLSIDAIFPNGLLAKLEFYLKSVKHIPFDAIRVADVGAYLLIKQLMPAMPIHFVDEMMLTNYYTVNYWGKKDAVRVRLAHELTLHEVLAVKQEATPEIEVLIQGAPMMFTSRRKLVENYLTFQKTLGKSVTLEKDNHFLYDEERDLYYPMIENEHGTHIYGGNDVCMIDDLGSFLTAGIDSFYIESFTYETEELVKIVHLYRMAIDLAINDKEKYHKVGLALYGEVDKLQPQNRRMDRGFYYKPTIYKNKN